MDPDHRAGPVHRPAHLARLAEAAGAGDPRRGQPPRASALEASPEVAQVDHEAVALPMMDISSTDIRARVAAGLSIDALVPAAVARYIDQHHLYRGTHGS